MTELITITVTAAALGGFIGAYFGALLADRTARRWQERQERAILRDLDRAIARTPDLRAR